MKGCGHREVMGHGESAICGETYYDEIWYCRDCWKAEAERLLAWQYRGIQELPPKDTDMTTMRVSKDYIRRIIREVLQEQGVRAMLREILQ